MKLSTKNIISVAILLASPLLTYAYPVELKGVDKAVHVGQVNNHIREEFVELQQEEVIDVTPYGPIFDLVCQSDLTDWCAQYPEQCSYVKTLCVRNESNEYCAFDIYKKYIEATNNNMNTINSYIDLCDECLIDMANEFQKVSVDEESINEMKTLAEMCKVKLFMDTVMADGDTKEDSEVISTLASLVPDANTADVEKMVKRHYGKIHSFKNPEVNGFVKSNGKIKYGHVGINEKVNTSIHNKNRSNQKRQDMEEEEEEVMMRDLKEKIVIAIENIRKLALYNVDFAFTNLEVNVNVLLEDSLFISDPESTREKNVLTDEIMSNIKDILNSDVYDINEEMAEYISSVVEPLEEQATATPIVDAEELETEAIEEHIIDVFEASPEDVPLNKKSKLGRIFNISEEVPVFTVSAMIDEQVTPVVEEEQATETTMAAVEEEATQSGEEGDDEENEGSGKESSEEEGQVPVVETEVPVIIPGKPSNRPDNHKKPINQKNPFKFGYPAKHEPMGPHGKQSILNAINKLFGESKYNPAEDRTNIYMPIKKWIKKSEYVVSNELHVEEEPAVEEEVAEVVDNEVGEVPILEKSIKLNNPDNHRDINDEEEPYEIGSARVTYINSVHPVKPSIFFREPDRKETH